MDELHVIVLAGISVAASTAAVVLPAQADTPSRHDAGAARCAYPADVLDLTNWKMTLPTGDDEDPTEITQP